MKKTLITLITLLGLNAFATTTQFSVQGQVLDQCSITVLSVPSSQDVGNILAHINASSEIVVPLEIDCNQAGLSIKLQSAYGQFKNLNTPDFFDYSVELSGPNIVSGGQFSGASLINETVIGTTALGSPAGTQFKIKPVAPAGPAGTGTYNEWFTLSVSSL